MTGIGMNLDNVAYWGTQYPFLDRMKTSGAWVYSSGGSGIAPVDRAGYPDGIAAGAKIAMMVSLDPSALTMSDRYVLTYDGTASFRLTNSTIVSTEPGKIVFDYTGAGSLQVTASNLSDGDPLADMHIVRADQQDLYDQGAVFTPEFIAKASQWSTLRFMDWGDTNNSSVAEWSDRAQIDDRSWANATDKSSVPLEIMVRLANETHVDMWYNMPAEASDDFVTKTLAYIRDNLDPGLKLNLEYSNEVWNWGFDQSHYAEAMGDQLWGKDVNGDGVIDPDNPAEHVADGWLRFYGYRSAQIAAISDSVFGASADARVDNVIATQTTVRGRETPIFAGVEAAGLGKVDDLFDSYAITTYFGNEISGAGLKLVDAAIVLGWALTGEIGMAAAFQELEFGGLLSGNNSLAGLRTYLDYQAGVAAAHGLDLVAYEGGAHLTPDFFATGTDAIIEDFIGRLMNDPRMGDLYAKMAADFADAGGTDLLAFNDSGTNGGSGYWGVLDSIYDDGSPRYDALAEAAAEDHPALLLKGGSGIDTLSGNSGHDALYGNAGDDKLSGRDGNDTLDGGAGNDILDGGQGFDRMVGGAGDDMYRVDSLYDVIVEAPGGGRDSVLATSSYILPDNIEYLRLNGTAIGGIGNAGDNILYGNDSANILDGRGGNDNIDGGAGNDTITGGAGQDLMTGGAGADRFVFAEGDLSTTRATDVIRDFSHAQGDRIDLSAIDANTATAQDDAFRFIGSGAFTGTAGQLQIASHSGTSWLLAADIDGDKVADLYLSVTAAVAPVSSDFVL